jgi:hypothetical protein
MASLWAQNQQNQTPDAMPPGLLSPVNMGDPGIDLHAGLAKIFPPAPQVSLDQNPQDQIQGAMANGNAPEADRINNQQKLAKDIQKDADPYGSEDNHPGFFGKLAHALSHATGGDTRRGWEEQGLAKQINTSLADESENASRNATTAHTQEETAEAPAKAASEEGLQGAQTENVQDEMSTRQAQLGNAYAHRLKAVMDAGGDPNTDAPMQHILAAMQAQTDATTKEKDVAPKSLEAKPGMYHGKPAFGNFHPDTGQFTDPQGNPMPGFQPQPQPALLGPIGVDTTGNVSRATPGKTLPEGFRTISQEGSLNSPTTMQRNSGGRADIVLSAIPDVLNDLHTNAAQLGPGMGRFNDIYSGKIGAPNPQFSGLMADLHLMGTAVALAHAQGRMSNELLSEFNNMIASPQQSPQNIEAVLGKVQNYMQRQSDLGAGKTQPGQAGAAGGKADYVFKDGKLVKQ